MTEPNDLLGALNPRFDAQDRMLERIDARLTKVEWELAANRAVSDFVAKRTLDKRGLWTLIISGSGFALGVAAFLFR